MMTIEARLNEALERIKQQNIEIAELKEHVKRERITASYYEREWRINNAGLSTESRARLHKAFEGHVCNGGLKEAINIEKRRYQQ